MTVTVPRFWVPFGDDISLADGGFLPDPTDEFGASYNERAAELSDLEDVSCLVLLGEPGSGKTTALAAELERQRGTSGRGQYDWLFVNLGGTREERTLDARIFGATAYANWLNGTHRLNLFLDSLDEARLRVETVASLLMEGLGSAPLDRLTLRVSCRTADRHRTLEEFFASKFGESFGVRELAPLRRRDVKTLAEASGVDAAGFIESVFRRDLQPLAVTPLTLNLLLKVTRERGEPPRSRIEAYEQGLRLLCAEPNDDRRTGGEAGGRLSAGERFSTAMRVAAALRLSGRTCVSREEVSADFDTAPASDLAGGRERDYTLAGSSTFEVSQETVEEAIGTALFTAHGDGRYGFVHASFAEYLAARWLSSANLHPDQVENLMTVEAPTRRTVAPQLREVGAWLVGMSDDFLNGMIEMEPAIALRGDLEQTTEEQRDRLVEALIRGAANDTIDVYGWRFQSTAAQLRHAGLVEQLRRVLQDSGVPMAARQAACDVVAACELNVLGSILTTIALDGNEPGPVRVHAVRALEKFADDATLRRLHPLATRELADDPDDELKGAALHAVWPRTLPAREMFRAITSPKNRSLLGLYKSFLWSDLVEGLDEQDLGVALRWAATLATSYEPMDALGEVREDLMVRAWTHLGARGIARAYPRVVSRLLSHHRDLLDRQRRQKHPDVLVGTEGRRAIVRELVSAVTDDTLSAVDLCFSTPPLVRADDFEWLVERLKRAVGRRNESGWASLIALVGMHAGRDVELLEIREWSKALHKETAGRFAPVALDSAAADRARKHRALAERLNREEAEERSKRVDIPILVGEALKGFSRSDPDGFVRAMYLLSVEADQRQFRWYESDLRELHGWGLLSREQRSELLDAAPVYLSSMEVDHKAWFVHRRVNHAAWAGYRAIRALHDLRPSALNRLQPRVWKTWAPVIIGWPRDGRSEPDFHQWALSQLSVKAPVEAAEWFGRKLDRDLRDGQVIGLDHFAVMWTPRIEELVLRRARRSKLAVQGRADLVGFLLQQDSEPGRRLARRLVTPAAIRAGGRRRELALRVALVLAKNATDREWGRLWALMKSFPSFGRDLIAELANDRRSTIAPLLSITDAAHLFELTEKYFPAAKDPPLPDGVGHVTARHQISDWRDDILRVISADGTQEAADELAAIAGRHPERPGLAYFARQAVESLLASSWSPPAPADVVRLSADRARRWVRSDRELRDVLIASLERARLELQGHTPAVEGLWNTRPVTPKPENALSNWLKRFFDQDLRGRGILVGRETEIRPGPGSRMGESVDLEIRAVAGERVEGASIVSVIVEVKGCWHREIDTAMETQLADRYLGSTTGQGIYLMGWFAGPGWSLRDRRRTPCGKRTAGEWERLLKQQAASLSSTRDVELSAVVLDCSLGI